MMPANGEIFLVTGGNGFLGQEIIKLLIEENLSEIRILDKVIEQAFVEDLQALTGGRIKVTAFIGDVRDKEVLQTACEGVTCVIHTASVIDVWGYISNEELEAINVKVQRLKTASLCCTRGTEHLKIMEIRNTARENIQQIELIIKKKEHQYCNSEDFQNDLYFSVTIKIKFM
ncbi:hydroxy-delta-5-steroid dehydrogenase, 3 beta- and steroid delta-isomerase 1 isoform X2 [Chiloscyllium plagiosum]|uniref:hydroxy-delta-5-steroid dehydrogenase, 3 beta- and steroid delta-isomerase 1 isoform X2 n=1 Tax=Chiloscyllium plagiosum TaxID=36176 RepID=UPI001CB84596|nr:hydroxy-delta-5-steroid dehydrogenase, 3 beta- and steroid delta-isomerase 1 isoform X2 [Chiloscyllium plagiosum]